MVAFVRCPEARLWNARLLPFLYLSSSSLAAIGVGEVVRSVAAPAGGRIRTVRCAPAGVVRVPIAACVALVVVGLPIDGLLLPGQHARRRRRRPTGSACRRQRLQPGRRRGRSGTTPGSRRKERHGATQRRLPPEYHDVVPSTRCNDARHGNARHGCGRAFWEYSKDRLERLRHADGADDAAVLHRRLHRLAGGPLLRVLRRPCRTTSSCRPSCRQAPSNPQRNLPYPSLDLTPGVQHLQMLGVKYYLASTTQAVARRRTQQPASDRGRSQRPVARLRGGRRAAGRGPRATSRWCGATSHDGQHRWLDPSVAWFLDPTRWDVPFASSGPEVVEAGHVPRSARRPAHESSTHVDSSSVRSAPIDQLPKVRQAPLPKVKVIEHRAWATTTSPSTSTASACPCWSRSRTSPTGRSSGADGPYRVTPEPHGGRPHVAPRADALRARPGRRRSHRPDRRRAARSGRPWRLPPIDMPERRRRDRLGPRPGPSAGPDGGDDDGDRATTTAPTTPAPTTAMAAIARREPGRRLAGADDGPRRSAAGPAEPSLPSGRTDRPGSAPRRPGRESAR